MSGNYSIVRRAIEPISATHYSAGDDIVEKQMRSGDYLYWTVIEHLPPTRKYPTGSKCAALSGRRFSSKIAAQEALQKAIGCQPRTRKKKP